MGARWEPAARPAKYSRETRHWGATLNQLNNEHVPACCTSFFPCEVPRLLSLPRTSNESNCGNY